MTSSVVYFLSFDKKALKHRFCAFIFTRLQSYEEKKFELKNNGF